MYEGLRDGPGELLRPPACSHERGHGGKCELPKNTGEDRWKVELLNEETVQFKCFQVGRKHRLEIISIEAETLYFPNINAVEGADRGAVSFSVAFHSATKVKNNPVSVTNIMFSTPGRGCSFQPLCGSFPLEENQFGIGHRHTNQWQLGETLNVENVCLNCRVTAKLRKLIFWPLLP